jgi:hypothetical protein
MVEKLYVHCSWWAFWRCRFCPWLAVPPSLSPAQHILNREWRIYSTYIWWNRYLPYVGISKDVSLDYLNTLHIINDQVELHYFRKGPILERFSGICYVNSGCFAAHIIRIPYESMPYSTTQRTIFELTHYIKRNKNFFKTLQKKKNVF